MPIEKKTIVVDKWDGLQGRRIPDASHTSGIRLDIGPRPDDLVSRLSGRGYYRDLTDAIYPPYMST